MWVQQNERTEREQVDFNVISQVESLSSYDNEAVTSSSSFWPPESHFTLAKTPFQPTDKDSAHSIYSKLI